MKASPWHDLRDGDIVVRVQAGESLSSIGSRYGLGEGRIRQIVREGLPDGPWPWTTTVRKVYTPELAESCLARWENGETHDQIARDVGVAPGTVRGWCHRLRYRRARAANTAMWQKPLDPSEREQARDLLCEAQRNEDWELVEKAIEVLGKDAWAAYDDSMRRK